MVKTKYKEERQYITEARHDEEKSQDPKKSDYILFLVSLIGGQCSYSAQRRDTTQYTTVPEWCWRS